MECLCDFDRSMQRGEMRGTCLLFTPFLPTVVTPKILGATPDFEVPPVYTNPVNTSIISTVRRRAILIKIIAFHTFLWANLLNINLFSATPKVPSATANPYSPSPKSQKLCVVLQVCGTNKIFTRSARKIH